jgi:hypothetical protein
VCVRERVSFVVGGPGFDSLSTLNFSIRLVQGSAAKLGKTS